MQARLEAEKKRAEEVKALESQRAAKEAAEKLAAENSKKAAALAISPEATAQIERTRADKAEKAASSGIALFSHHINTFHCFTFLFVLRSLVQRHSYQSLLQIFTCVHFLMYGYLSDKIINF